MEETNPSNFFLIVENDADDAFLIKRALQTTPQCGSSFICRNSSEAQAYLVGAGMYSDRKRYPVPDVILTDLRMGEETGIELVTWIRRQPAPLRDTTIIILSGSASPAQFEAAKSVGAERVYQKPGKVEDLEGLLRAIAEEFCRRGKA